MPACPRCGSANVHRSRRRGLPALLLGLIRINPVRCHNCNHRFRAFIPPRRRHERRAH
jgi:hypothetical protein